MKRNILIALAVVVVLGLLAAGLVLLRGNEDTWLCSNGQWVKHGNPSAPQPTTPCGGAVACTADAMICPDGSTVGREGPNCEFKPCPGSTGLANPASVNCQDKGGKLEIRKDSSGGEVGYCQFNDGSECEEWAFFRGECQVGSSLLKNWQTYTNSKLNFTVKYPKDFEAIESSSSVYFESKIQKPSGFGLSIFVKTKTVDQLISELKAEATNNNSSWSGTEETVMIIPNQYYPWILLFI